MSKTAAFLIVVSLSIGTAAQAKETWGYIDRQGQWLIPPQYHTKADVMNAKASLVVKPVSKAIEQLPQKGASRKLGDTATANTEEKPVVEQSPVSTSQAQSELIGLKPELKFRALEWQYVGRDGKPLINASFSSAEPFLPNGTAFVRRALMQPLEIIDTKGQTVRKLDPRIKRIGIWSDGLAPANCAPVGSGDVLDGYIDEAGVLVIEPQFSWGGSFKEGLAPVLIGEHWSYIDRTGKKTIDLPESASHALPFMNGCAFVAVGGIAFEHEYFNQRHGALWGVINRQGKFVVEPQFIAPQNYGLGFDFTEGLAPIRMRAGESKKYGFIDDHGQMAISPKYLHASEFRDGGAAVSVGDSSFSSADFKSQRERMSLAETFFDEFKVIGMEKKQLHDLLGLPGTSFDRLNSANNPAGSNQIAQKEAPDRDSYLLNAPSCGNACRWLEIDYKQDHVRRYRYRSKDKVGGWVYEGRQPELALEFVDTPRDEIDRERGVIGLQIYIRDKKIAVSQVTPGLPAAQAGLLKDDEIISVDGNSVTGDWYDSFYKRLAGSPGSSVTIKIRRGKLTRDIAVRRMWVGDIADFRTRCEFLRGAD